jgi:hypothetical protein
MREVRIVLRKMACIVGLLTITERSVGSEAADLLKSDDPAVSDRRAMSRCRRNG